MVNVESSLVISQKLVEFKQPPKVLDLFSFGIWLYTSMGET